jgi:hypothetical protein
LIREVGRVDKREQRAHGQVAVLCCFDQCAAEHLLDRAVLDLGEHDRFLAA